MHLLFINLYPQKRICFEISRYVCSTFFVYVPIMNLWFNYLVVTFDVLTGNFNFLTRSFHILTCVFALVALNLYLVHLKS